ncbi:hypothetical protein F2P81_010867 [Scophthalmus maximus]|uniref:Uncharacterized protein n=1 Tax=Scophthalmus maximus TaxID=52904 RepID=A0A6A4SVQ7_SCOMX|nr:hypothetical protein F2P81_010867 [Scophthalmus maximus]
MQLHDRLCGQCTLWRKNSTKWIRNMTCCTVNCPFVVIIKAQHVLIPNYLRCPNTKRRRRGDGGRTHTRESSVAAPHSGTSPVLMEAR